ncbi:hypothetical protein [Parasitella parasitica]|uniref:Uncharacterized protein n=1 Tax=Parasitella parasitica TaxID=35722 RepID=A0A0B7NDJ0_9FUNG|nr:hypothetical protein [Parasitella parasitica]
MHDKYLSIDLSEEEKDQLDQIMTKRNPAITPSAAVTRINTLTGATIDSLIDINVILGSNDRAKYELNASRVRQCLKNTFADVFEKFASMQEKYEEYFLRA